MTEIKYTDRLKTGCRYVLDEDYEHVWLTARPALIWGSVCTIEAGTEWDGPSGPTINWECSMRASLVHDCFYRRMNAIDDVDERPKYRKMADKEFRAILKADGMGWFQRNAWYLGVRLFG